MEDVAIKPLIEQHVRNMMKHMLKFYIDHGTKTQTEVCMHNMLWSLSFDELCTEERLHVEQQAATLVKHMAFIERGIVKQTFDIIQQRNLQKHVLISRYRQLST